MKLRKRCDIWDSHGGEGVGVGKISGSHGVEYEVTVFWKVAPCSLVETDRPDDGGCKHLWDVG
jgi:hypothetical protein